MVSYLLNDPEHLQKIEEIRMKYSDNQVAFINRLSLFFECCLNELPPAYRKIILLFAKHGTALTAGDIVFYSHQKMHRIKIDLSQLEKAGILEKLKTGKWQLKNHDLLCYVIVQFSSFTRWMKKKKKGRGKIINRYISVVNKRSTAELGQSW